MKQDLAQWHDCFPVVMLCSYLHFSFSVSETILELKLSKSWIIKRESLDAYYAAAVECSVKFLVGIGGKDGWLFVHGRISFLA